MSDDQFVVVMDAAYKHFGGYPKMAEALGVDEVTAKRWYCGKAKYLPPMRQQTDIVRRLMEVLK